MARIKVTETRSERRKERYRHLILLGFSAKNARKFRDQSADHIRGFEDSERTRITEVRASKRSDEEKKIIREIRQSRRIENRVETGPRLKPKSERQDEFSQWTADRNFPSWADQFIAEQNEERGLDPLDSYGFRRFWHHYVDGIPVEDIGDLADRGDSNIERAS